MLVGNSMGCPISLETADRHPDRVERVVLVAPAGGLHNRPLRRAMGQLAVDGVRESPRMARVAVPDYVRFGPINALRLFGELTRFPSLERLLEVPVPTLAVIGSRDPLMPDRARILEVARQVPGHVTVAVITGAAHAVNFSHGGELAHVIRSWLAGEEIVDDPDPARSDQRAADPALRKPAPPTRHAHARRYGATTAWMPLTFAVVEDQVRKPNRPPVGTV